MRKLGIPTSPEVDCVAEYCDVAARLLEEVFFGEDNHDVLCRHSTGMSVELEHSAVFNSALSLFRQLWMKQDASFYGRVRNVLYRYQRDGTFEHARILFYDYYDALRKSILYPDLVKLPNEDIIDLWLNTRFAHGGTNQKKGRFSRKDFEALAATTRVDVIEFSVRMAVKLFWGGPFVNLYRVVAVSELKRYREEFGLFPSFELHANRAVRYKQLAEQNPLQIVNRLLNRHQFSRVASLIAQIGLTNEHIVTMLLRAECLDQAIRLSHAKVVDSCFRGRKLKLSSSFSETRKPWRSGAFKVFAGHLISFEGEGYEIMKEEFQRLRETFFAEQSGST